MSFGVLGVIPLYVVRQRIKRLEVLTGGWDGGKTVIPAASAPSP
jgi:hypothetical protein